MAGLIDLKRTKKEGDDSCCCDDNDYPWGMSLHLDDETLSKLGLEKLEVGAVVQVVALVKVTSFRLEEESGKSVKSGGMQIQQLGFMGPKPDGTTTSDILYGK